MKRITIEPASVIDLLTTASDNHAIDSCEPDHAIGDLQAMLACAWEVMTPTQRAVFLTTPEVESVIEHGARNEFTVSDLMKSVQSEAHLDCHLVRHINMAEFFSYDFPRLLPQWRWIEAHAQMSHRNNGEYGVWEFMLNLDPIREDDGQKLVIRPDVKATIPNVLDALIDLACADGIDYIVFHQGT